jgi:hypothetical protein
MDVTPIPKVPAHGKMPLVRIEGADFLGVAVNMPPQQAAPPTRVASIWEPAPRTQPAPMQPSQAMVAVPAGTIDAIAEHLTGEKVGARRLPPPLYNGRPSNEFIARDGSTIHLLPVDSEATWESVLEVAQLQDDGSIQLPFHAVDMSSKGTLEITDSGAPDRFGL